MATKQDKMKVVQALREKLAKRFPDADVFATNGWTKDEIWVYVVCERFKHIRFGRRWDMVQKMLDEALNKSPLRAKIGHIFVETPEEYENFEGLPYYAGKRGRGGSNSPIPKRPIKTPV